MASGLNKRRMIQHAVFKELVKVILLDSLETEERVKTRDCVQMSVAGTELSLIHESCQNRSLVSEIPDQNQAVHRPVRTSCSGVFSFESLRVFSVL